MPLVVLAPVIAAAALAVYTPLALLVAVIVKRVLVGRYRPADEPVWGSFYVRHWMVLRTLRLVPWRLLEGTAFQTAALRALGARIGRRVHLHRGVDLLHGGWDLLEIEDDVSIAQDAGLQLVHLEDGRIVVGPVFLGAGATLDVHASVGPGARVEAGAFLGAWSSLPAGSRVPPGERWTGIPSRPDGLAPPTPAITTASRSLSPAAYSVAFGFARLLAGTCLAAPAALSIAVGAWTRGLDGPTFVQRTLAEAFTPGGLTAIAAVSALTVVLWCLLLAWLVRALAPAPGQVIGRWSVAYLRVWLATGFVRAAGEWLSGSLFWPPWLRLAGMRIGRDCEISTIIDVVPSHVSIGPESFFADGIYLAGPRVHRGTVTLAHTRLGTNTFLGNHAIVPGGQHLPDDILLGVCTIADDSRIGPGTSWFGHPPFELPRRERVEADRRLTHDPSLVRYVNRLAWETLRLGLPVVPIGLALAWFAILRQAEAGVGLVTFALVAVPGATLGALAAPCAIVLGLKWGLLGRVRPGRHALWSCWCSRWDFLYMAWGFWARRALAALDGSLLLTWYLRAMGMHVGRGAVLGGGFAQVVDPDMIHIEDGATVTCLFQAHTFEDRVLKIDRVFIRREATLSAGTVVLYGADIGERAYVAPHSVVMKRERLLPGRAYEGCPTRPA
jgi:non-ribosomal peptide synthetase-like protein